MRIVRWLPAALLALAGCESVNVKLDCVTTAGPTVNCDLIQTEGKSEVEVCWDFKVTCDNGTTVTPPRSCAKVKGGGTARYVIPKEKLAGAEKCDANPKATVSNVTLNGKKSE